MTAEDPQLRYRADIDGLRAVAVLPVVFYHSTLGFSGGFVGVDVFFVISGFLITKIIYDLVSERKFSFFGFYARRIRRLFPALFVLMLAVTLWSSTHLIWLDLRDFGRSLFSATAYISNVFFYVTTGYFNEAARTKPLLHTWSLAVEEQFYIAVPFVIFAMVRWTSRRFHVPLILAIAAVSFLLCIWLTRIDTPGAFYLLPTRAWELALGAVLSIAGVSLHRQRWLAEAASIGGLAAILFAVFAFSDATPFPGWHAAIPTIGTAGILSTGGKSGALVERLLATPPFTFIGKISYSLYLWHWPVIVAFGYGVLHPISTWTSTLCVLLSIGLATLSWRYLELPFRRRRLLPTPKSLFAGAAMASVLAAGTGIGLYLANGIPQRHPRQLIALLDQSSWGELRPECSEVTAARAAAGRLCARGAAGAAPSFILVGDSHAAALSDGIFAAARSRGLAGVQFTANGFVPLPGRRSLMSRRSLVTATPADLTPAFVSYAHEHPLLRTIIATGFWVHEATGRSYRNPLQIFVDDQYNGSGAAYNPVALRHALDRLIEELPDRQFILLDDVPSGPELSLEEYAREVYEGYAQPVTGLSRSQANAQRATYEPVLQAVAATHPNVIYVPTLSHLCGPALCPLFRPGGIPVFRDGDHLSRYGSMDLAPALGAVFDHIRPQPPRFKLAAR
jgi:peptidoglycan/LPS O-acetylase OafA/YrhL